MCLSLLNLFASFLIDMARSQVTCYEDQLAKCKQSAELSSSNNAFDLYSDLEAPLLPLLQQPTKV